MFKHSKISIRVSIITLFVILLSVIGLTIIGINYIAFNKILSTSAHKLMDQTSRLVKLRIHSYLTPLSLDLISAKNAINRGIINPDDTTQFNQFLFELIRYNPEIYMVYYGTVTGNFYGVDREQPGAIGLTHIINSQSPPVRIRYEINDKGIIVKKKNLSNDYDPRVRPWFQSAIKEKKPIWTDIYQFYVFDQSDYLVPGITAAAPIYDKNHQVKGVFAMDLTVDGIQHFIRELNITPNALIYITNEKNQVIAFRNPVDHEDIRGRQLTDDLIAKYKLPLKNIDLQNNELILSTYTQRGEDYFLVHQPISEMKGDQTWYVTLVIPADDVLGPLKQLSLQAFIFTIIVLILGTIIVRYISQRISHPIVQLADEAKDITKLNLSSKPPLNTRIKEISLMDSVLANMRTSLASFQRYVPSSLVKQLIKTGKIAKVGGEKQLVTILFSDIQSFTSLSEQTSPDKLMDYLSDYFQTMTDSVINHSGTIDKYIGDAVMALWNAPKLDSQHTFHACQSAIDMINQVEKFNSTHCLKGFPHLQIRIGIHTGEAVVGNVGSDDRLSYTALGDAVNLASRLEAINKTYGTNIIVSNDCYQIVKEHFTFRFLDVVAVRGKQESTTIYELITVKNLENFAQYQKEFSQAYAEYQKGNWKESLHLFEELTPVYEGDELNKVYLMRCQTLLSTSPEKWDGIWRGEQNYS